MLLTTYTTGPSKQYPDIPLTAAIGACYHLVGHKREGIIAKFQRKTKTPHFTNGLYISKHLPGAAVVVVTSSHQPHDFLHLTFIVFGLVVHQLLQTQYLQSLLLARSSHFVGVVVVVVGGGVGGAGVVTVDIQNN